MVLGCVCDRVGPLNCLLWMFATSRFICRSYLICLFAYYTIKSKLGELLEFRVSYGLPFVGGRYFCCYLFLVDGLLCLPLESRFLCTCRFLLSPCHLPAPKELNRVYGSFPSTSSYQCLVMAYLSPLLILYDKFARFISLQQHLRFALVQPT